MKNSFTLLKTLATLLLLTAPIRPEETPTKSDQPSDKTPLSEQTLNLPPLPLKNSDPLLEMLESHNKPMNEPPLMKENPMLGLLNGLFGGPMEKKSEDGPKIHGFMQVTKEHMLPDGKMEIEKISKPLASSPLDMLMEKPKMAIEVGNPLAGPLPIPSEILKDLEKGQEAEHPVEIIEAKRMHPKNFNPLTGLLSALPLLPMPMQPAKRHGMIIKISKPMISGPNGMHMAVPVREEIISVGKPPASGFEGLMDHLMSDLIFHRVKPDIDVNEWHKKIRDDRGNEEQRNPILMPNPIDDINSMLMKLLKTHSKKRRFLKKHSLGNPKLNKSKQLRKPSYMAKSAAPAPKKNLYKKLRKSRISTKPDLNALIGSIQPVNLDSAIEKVIKHKKKKRKLVAPKPVSKMLDAGLLEQKSKFSKEMQFLNDLEHLGDTKKKLRKFKRKYKKYLNGLEKIYNHTSDSFKKIMSKSKFMNKALKNKTLFKQFLVKDLRRKNRKLNRMFHRELNRHKSAFDKDLDAKLNGLSRKTSLLKGLPLPLLPMKMTDNVHRMVYP